MSKLLYPNESYEIRGACFDVWKEFKGAFKEKVIERAMVIALKDKGLKVDSQKKINIYYKEQKVGLYIPDIIVNDVILIELKSKPMIYKQDLEQFWTYIKGSKYKLGFLINFGTSLEIKRVIYDTARHNTSA